MEYFLVYTKAFMFENAYFFYAFLPTVKTKTIENGVAIKTEVFEDPF